MSNDAMNIEGLTPEERRALLARLLREKADKPESYPLSFAQQRLWFVDQLERSAAYNVPLALRITGRLDVAALERSLTELIDRHSVLRAAFMYADGQPRQVIAESVTLDLAVVDLSKYPGTDREVEARRLAIEESERIFDLAKGPLIRAKLLRLGEEEHLFLVTMHHIVSDGWSLGVFNRELTALYQAYSAKQRSPLSQLPIQYVDFAHWQRIRLQGELLDSLLAYWKRQLADLPELRLPTDRPRPARQSFRGAWDSRVLPRNLSQSLKEFSRKESATLFMVLLSAFQILLHRYSGQESVVLGTPIANRTRKEVEGLIGFFANTLVIRGDATGNPSVREYLGRIREMALEAYAHQELPFERLVEELQPARDLSRNPLVQVIFALQNAPMSPLALEGIKIDPLESPGVGAVPLGMPWTTTRFDMEMHIWEKPEGIHVSLIYNTDLFDPATICRLLSQFQMVLEGIVSNPDQSIAGLPLLTEAERRQAISGWNRSVSYPKGASLAERFEGQAERTPDSVALICEGEEVSYGELNRRANRLAHRLRELGVKPDQLVGLRTERGVEMVVGILGILKSGGAYLPLDPAYPRERVAFMLEDSRVGVVVTQKALAGDLQGVVVAPVLLDDPHPSVETNPTPVATADSLAYVIYTSGSTGKPKGAQITHYNVTRLFEATQEWYRFDEKDVWTLFHSYAFDFSVWELWGALLYGGRLVVVPHLTSRSPEAFRNLLVRERVTVLNQTPSAFRQLAQAELAQPKSELALRYVIFGGEALELQSLRPWFERYGDERPKLVNMYGITETTVHVTYRPIRKADLDSGQGSVIGIPIPDLQIYILDPRGEPAPIGLPGELYVGGAGVARGYLNRPDLTAQRFLADTFAPANGSRLYRTGDLARRLENGDIEYLGRIDQQVKIRGYRIELGEIETAIAQHPAVHEVVVLAREDDPGDKRLVAYVVVEEPATDLGERLRAYLRASLPEYMVPSYFVALNALPLTENGKVDRKALPVPDRSGAIDAAYVAPRTATEETLAGIWADVLKLERVGVNQNFFELGGHSLLAASVIERMRRTGLHADIRTLFATPTIAALAATVGGESSTVDVPPNRIPSDCEAIAPEMLPLVRLTSEEIERVVAAVPGGAANVQDIYPLAPLQEGILFHHLMASKGDPYLLYALFGFDSRARLDGYLKALQAVIERHDILRTAVLWEGLPEPVQVVWRKAPLVVEEVRLDAAKGDIAGQLRARFDPRHYRLDVRQAPLLRVFIAQDTVNSRWMMLLLFHHLAIDHTTLEVMQQEIQASLLGQAGKLPVPLPFRNFVAQTRLGVSREEHEAYFKKLLADVDEPTAPFGLINAKGDGSGITEAHRPVDAQLAKRLRERSRALGVSAASVCHLAWAQVLARVSERDDVVFGTVLIGRMQSGEGADRVLGLFINTLPVRIRIGEQTVEEAVLQVHTQLSQLLRHEHASLALVQRCSAVAAPAPLFTALFNFRHSAAGIEAPAGAHAARPGIEYLGAEERTNYPFVISVDDLGEGFALTAQVQSPMDPARICDYMNSAVAQLVAALESTPTAPLRSLIPRGDEVVTISKLLADAYGRDILIWAEGDRLQSSAPVGALTPELRDRLRESKSEILAYLREPAELSISQQRLWFLDQFEPGAATYVITGAAEMRGVLDVPVLERAVEALVNRHDALRTVFLTVGGEPRQVVSEPGPWALPVMDLSAEEHPRQRLEKLAQEEASRGFDLTRGPLLRTQLYRLAADTHVLQFSMPHINADGWSLGVLTREIGELYRGLVGGKPAALPVLRVQYRDFARWQRGWLQGEVLEIELAHWRTRLAGAPQVLELPTDRPRPPVESHRGALYRFRLPQELVGRLRALSRREGTTLFMTLLSGFALLLARYSGQQDLLIGTPVANRNRAEIEGLVGFFVNTQLLRADISGEPSVTEFLARMRDVCLDAIAHRELPYERLVEEFHPARDLSRNAMFQVMFVLQNAPDQLLELPGLTLTDVDINVGTAQVDLTLNLQEMANGIRGSLNYATDLFDESTIARLAGHWRSLLEAMVAAPEQRVSELPLLTDSERKQVVEEWNATASDYPAAASVHELFEAQAARTPDAVAVEYEERSLTYAQLDARANQVARYLARHGVGPEVMVGLCVERSLEMVVGTLGILKAGGAYVPLDPDYPASRLAFMLEDTAAPVLLTQARLRERLPAFAGRVISLDTEWEEIAREGQESLGVSVNARNLAYVIYTSGSTGRPKGTCIEHRSVVRLVRNTNYIELGPQEVFLQFAPISFDASTLELWGTLLNGAKLVVCPAGRLSLQELGRVIKERGVTTLWLTAALFHQMVDEQIEALRGVRQLLAGGETLSVPHVRRMLEAIGEGRLINGYGPTENTTFTCCHVMKAGTRIEHTVPIGRPISNTRVYILDVHRHPVPAGVNGELYIGGDGLAREYLHQPELTAEKFVPDPFSTAPGARLYRTGDLVRYLPDGNIEFLGRIDNQVKIRGYRIELGEIEAALSGHPAVREAVVLAREDDPGDKRLAAYVVAEAPAADLAERLRAHLRATLPDYMVPSAFVVLEKLPLTPVGKVDRRALPAPERSALQQAAYVAPQSDLEQRIAAVWREMLKLEQVGVRDNFFDLGGHSLLVMKTCTRLCTELNREIKVVDLFAYPTIEALAGYLGEEKRAGGVAQEAHARVKRRSGDPEKPEPIAIIGLAGRFPGAGDIETFWANLREGRESIAFFSKEELRESGVPAALLEDPNYVRARGYLEDADKFDAGFFGYSAREAETIDPQQRLFLECSVEALDRAGYDPDRYPGLIGVYAGSSLNSYLLLLQSQHGSSRGALSVVLGSGQDFLTTRVSYKLNLRGPSLSVQTACSTSLVAVHEACRALQDRECDMALAGGVSVIVPLKSGYPYLEEGILSPDGHCRAFDAGANGTVGGNGVAIVVLKRLSEALADGDHVHAVILGTAINNDGSSKVGYTAPSVEGQSMAIALAQATAQCDPDTIDYVEAHGTGTLLGDPIEVAALARVFGDGGKRRAERWIGSLKSNMGHLDAAAGAAGLIKTALSLEHKEIPPSLHFSQPNPQIDFAAGRFKVNAELRKWESPGGKLRRAGVSSFGMGGTNAHAVLEEAPAAEPTGPSRDWQLLCLSAKSNAALEHAKANLARHLGEHPGINLADAAYTLQVGRGEFSHRCIVACRSAADAVAALESGAAERVIHGVHKGGSRSVVFMFTGQGSQYPNMGLGLYRTESVFRDAVDRCCERLMGPLSLDLREVLFPAEGGLEKAAERLKRTELTQPALFVVEYALARLWMSLGIQPVAMIGHSVGEYVAACLAGVMSLEDALDLVAERGRLMGRLPPGAMLAVALAEAELLPILGERLAIAAINGPSLCVVSGPEADIAVLEAQLIKRELAPRRLHTSHAFHSSMMEPILESFTRRVRAIKLNSPRMPYLSNLSGEWITPAQATDPAYYATHLRRAVRFSQGLERLLADPKHVFLEVGPGQTLAGLARRHPAKKDEHAFVTTLRHPEETRADEAIFMESAGRLWLAGARPDWAALHAGQRRRRVQLPTYPFERRRYWVEASPPLPVPGPGRVQRLPDPRDWIYVPSWKRAPAPSAAPATRGTSWLIFTDRHGLGVQLEAELAAGGARIASVAVGKRFAKKGPGRYVVNPALREDYDRLLADLKLASFAPESVVHLWSVNRDGVLREDEKLLAERQNRGFFSVVFLAQALVAAGLDSPLRLAVITTHAQDVTGGESVCPEQAMALGPCKVIGMEHPHLRARAIDVSLNGDLRGLARELTADLCAPWTDTVSAYRGRYRWAQVYERIRAETPAGRPPALRDAGVYLITGGLGSIGLEIARYLARVAGAKVALVSRSGLPAREQWARWLADHDQDDETSRRIRGVQAIEAEGGEALVCRADVANERQMRAAIAAAEARFGKLCGVMHAAGVEKRGQPLQTVQRGHCDDQFRPKVQGLRVLEKVLRGRSLDFCVVHSSLASAMGVMGFVSYVASHLYMDAFVYRHNRGTGMPWRTINWDNWNIGDSTAGYPGAPKIEFHMSAEEATNALARILSLTGAAQILVSSGDLQGRIDQWIGSEAQLPAQAETTAVAPAPQGHPRPALSTEYVAPRNDGERTLAGIWAEMLGIDRVGVHDNFFELGGDSVVNIQIAARANQAGVRVTPRQVFEHQTIAALAAIAGTAKAVTFEQGDVTGTVPLTPIQQWFFDRDLPHPEHFNMPMLLEVQRPMDMAVFRQAIERLQRHHDALRLRYSKTERGWAQQLVEPGPVRVHEFDLTGLPMAEQLRRIEDGGTELQKSLDLARGPVMQVAYFDLGPKQPGRLLLAIHHLVVDMVSWRILLEDLRTLCEALSAGQDATLPAKTASIKRWAEALTGYAQTKEAEAELGYWLSVGSRPIPRLPVDFEQGDNTVGSSAILHEELGEEETRALLTDLPRAYKTQINDALLLALVKTICGWTGGNSVLVDLEGHGREAISDGMDVSRTVGWFTTLSPLQLELPPARGYDRQIGAMQAQLKAVPHHGMGFGVLRYLSANPATRSALEKLPHPELSFLYMGQFDAGVASGSWLVPASESAGSAHDPAAKRRHLLEINSIVSGGRLQVSWTYSRNRHRDETARSLARAYMDALRSLIASCPKGRAVRDGAPGSIAGGVSDSDLAEISRQLGATAREVR